MIVLELIPSIDIYGGKVVRFVQGNPDTSVIYSGDPINIAKKWANQGADAIHVVDLDSVIGTNVNNRAYIKNIVDAVQIPVQVGGGIRDFNYASLLFKEGVTRLVFGTLAFNCPSDIKRLIKTYGSAKVVVALDYLDKTVVVKGWATSTGISLEAAISKFQNIGVEFFLLTSVERDGTLVGPDYSTLRTIQGKFKMNILASGGICCVHDLLHLSDIGVYGAIIGKALYEEKFSLKLAKSAISAMRRE